MKKVFILLSFLLPVLFAGKTYAQNIDTATVVVSGGNAVVMVIPPVNKNATRSISRAVGTASNYSALTTIKQAETFAAFRAIAGDTVIASLKQMKKLNSDKSLWSFLEGHPGYKEFGFALTNLRFLKAMGWAYVDSSINKLPVNTKVFYKVTDATNNKTDTGSCTTGRQPNAQQPVIVKYQADDSLLFAKWGFKSKSRWFLPMYAYVYKKNEKGVFEKMTSAISATHVADSVYFGLSNHVAPNLEYTYYIQPVDMFNNPIDVHSDTVTILSVNYRRLPAVIGTKATDTLNGIMLSWKKQPANLFFKGIVIQRALTATGDYTALTTVPVTDSTYLDKTPNEGQTYFYRLRVVGIKEDVKQQKSNGFSGYATAKHVDKHARLLAPYNLTVATDPKGVKLNWQQVTSSMVVGYYVYRMDGVDTANMKLVSRLLTGTTYIDTTKNASRRLNYSYAVKSVSFTNAQSPYSNQVQAKLPFGLDKPITPAFINATRKDNTLFIQWEDTKLADNYISGYVLYKHKIVPGEKISYDVNKKASEEATRLNFVRVSKDTVKRAYYTVNFDDSGDQYEYAVAAVDVLNGESGLSALAVNTAEKVLIAPPVKLILTNIDNKVELTWLQGNLAGVKGYNVYRKAIGEKDFKKVANVDVKSTTWADNAIQPEKVYFYKIKAVNSYGESARAAANSIKIY